MEVMVDGHKVDSAEGAIDKVKLNEIVKKHYGNSSRIIVTAKVGGLEYDFSRNDIDFASGSVIELLTATPKEIAAAGVYDAVVMLENAKLAIRQSSEKVLLGDFEDGMAKFAESINVLQWVAVLISKVRDAGVVNFSEDKPYTKEFFAEADNLNGILEKTEEYIKSKDTVMISDTLEYELLPCVERWQSSLPELYTDIVEGSTLH